MVNAIQYILSKRSMKNNKLIDENQSRSKISKQSLSKYINRQRRIPDYAYLSFEKILNVPHELFVDKNGYCKELTEKEVYELDYYLETHPLTDVSIVSDNELYEREAILERGTKLCLKRIKKDIYSVHTDTEIESVHMYIDEFESNLSIYETFQRLHKSKILSYDEWRSIFKAISYLIDNATQEDINNGHNLSHYIYDAIIKYRKEKDYNDKEDKEIQKIFYSDLIPKSDEDDS